MREIVRPAERGGIDSARLRAGDRQADPGGQDENERPGQEREETLFLMFLPLWMVTLIAAYGAARRDPTDGTRRSANRKTRFPSIGGMSDRAVRGEPSAVRLGHRVVVERLVEDALLHACLARDLA